MPRLVGHVEYMVFRSNIKMASGSFGTKAVQNSLTPVMTDDTDLLVRPEEKIEMPKPWVVIIHNDDFTPMDFVVKVVETVFNKSFDEASEIMFRVHQDGLAHVDVYPRDIAELKVRKVLEMAEKDNHPLLATAEETVG